MQRQTKPFAQSQHIDGFQFAESGRALRGSWPLVGFARLQDVLSAADAGVEYADVEYEIRGARDGFGRIALRVAITGNAGLICQRCLSAVAFSLKIDSLLVLAHNEAEIEAQPVDPEGPDRIVGSKEMSVEALLEDEIVLAIPFAPRHVKCAGDDESKSEAQASPFADLRGLLNAGGRVRK